MTPSEAPRDGTALLVGPAVTSVLPVKAGRVERTWTVIGHGGRLPETGALGGPDGPRGTIVAVVSRAGTPRVTIDGRGQLNRLAVRVSAAAVLEAGAILAGPLPSDAVAVDLFAHELARQNPDALVLTQPIAGDKLWALARYLRQPSAGGRPLTVIYNGPSGYQHRALEGLSGCVLRQVPSAAVGGRADAGPTIEALKSVVDESLKAALAQAGYGEVLRSSLGQGAATAVPWLELGLREAVVPDRGGGDGLGFCLLCVEPTEVQAFAPGGRGSAAISASASLTGTGTIDLAGNGRIQPGNVGTEGWLPPWDDLAARLPVALETAVLGNLVGEILVEPWALPGDLTRACVGGALAEELIARLASRWAEAVGPEGSPASSRLLVGTGFGLARLGDARHAAYTILNALQPAGITAVAVDLAGSLLFGGLGRSLPDLAAVNVSPLRAEHDWRHSSSDPWAVVTLEPEGEPSLLRRLVPGRVGVIPLAVGRKARLTIEPCRRDLDFGAGPGRTWSGTVAGSSVGVVLDGRGRPFRPAADPALRTAKQREFLAAFGVIGRAPGRGQVQTGE